MFEKTETLDRIFSITFGKDKFDAPTEFAYIVIDFMKRVYPDIGNCSTYMSEINIPSRCLPEKGLQYRIINILLVAARHEHDYAREMLCRLYKVYYKREYNQIKRFESLTHDEILSFENKEEPFTETASRIMTIGPLMGIELLPDCIMILAKIEKNNLAEEYGYEKGARDIAIDPELLLKAAKEAKDLVERQTKTGKDKIRRGSASKFREYVSDYLHVPVKYDFDDKERKETENNIAVTIALLRARFRNKIFTDEEILLYHEIYGLIKEFTDKFQDINIMSDIVLCREGTTENGTAQCRYQPEKQKVATPPFRYRGRSDTENQIAGIELRSEANRKEKELAKENEELKTALKQKQQKIDEIKKQYLEAKDEVHRIELDKDQWESDRNELFKLREYVFSLTEEDVEITSVSLEDMKEDLKPRRIIIVGGHDNWVGYLKEIFPGWTYIKPSISNTLPEIHAINAEYLFFFTDTISHGSFGKYMNIVKKHNLKYSYLHGTNIDRTIYNVYKEVTGEKKTQKRVKDKK